MRPDSGAERGFTLMEVLVVLVILGLALGVVAARGPARHPALDLRATTEQVARGLRLVRSQAIAANRDMAFTIDVVRREFQAGQGAWVPFPPTLDLGVTGVPARAGSAARIVFAPDGGSTGGRVRLAAGTAALGISVNWLSGRVTVDDGR